MTRNMDLGLGDPNDHLAVARLRLMKEDERHWFKAIDDSTGGEDEGNGRPEAESESGEAPLLLVLFLPSDSSPKPQIMGTVASLAVGNLFPAIVANMAKDYLRKIHDAGLDEDNKQHVMFVKQMRRA